MITNLNIKESKIGIFSDIHIGLGQNSQTWHTNILEFAEWCKDFYKKKKIKTLIIPGDIFHNRNEISVQTLNVANKFFQILKDFKIIISTGNHDCYYKDRSDVNSISIFNNWPNIHIIDSEPLTINVCEKKISFIPWGTDLEKIPCSNIIFGHFEINSFKYNNFSVCENGLTSKDLLQKAPLIISGHFHTKDSREYQNGKIVYLGSPYQQNFGDIFEERGIYIFDIETEEFEFIHNTVSPVHLKLSLKNILENKLEKEFLKKCVPNNMVCLLVDIQNSTEHINTISAQIQELNPKFFRIDYKIDNLDLNSNLELDENYSHLNITKSITDFVNSLNSQYKNDICEYILEKYNKIKTA